MKNLKNTLLLCFILLAGFILSGCEKEEIKIEFDNTYPLALSPSVEWAVVKEPYAAYKKEPSWDSEVIEHCRRGDVVQVEGRSVDTDGNKWCRFEEGWLPESCLNVYGNRLKAERVSEILLKTNSDKVTE